MKKLFTKWLLAAALVSTCWQVNAQVNLQNGLVAYFPFNGNANDSSGNNLNGTIQAGVLDTTDRFNKPNHALFFPGGNGLFTGKGVLIPTNSLLNFTSSYSFNVWTYYLAENNFNWEMIFSKGRDVNNSYVLSYKPSADSLHFVHNNGNGTVYEVDAKVDLSNKWVNLTGVVDVNNNSMSLYVNGNLANTVTFTAINLIMQSANGLGIGYHEGDNGIRYPFNGKIDDVRFYNRVLTPQEINALYTGTVPGNTSTTTSNINTTIEISNGLAAYYPFAGNLNDISGNNWNGTITGTATYAIDRNGISGNALSLDGNSFVNTLFPGIPGTQARTVNLWVKSNTYISGSYPILVSYGPDSPANSPNLNDFKVFRAGIDIVNQQNISFDIGNSAVAYKANIYDNNWHMLTYLIPTNSQMTQVQVFLDCQMLTTPGYTYIPLPGTIINTDTSKSNGAYRVKIGTSEYGNNHLNNFSGLIDDVRIYGRTLNQQEICTLKNAYEIISVNTVTVTSFKTVTVTSTVIVHDCGTVTGINSAVRSASNISVFPNPSSTSISVVSNSGTPVNSVSIFNSQGILVLTTSSDRINLPSASKTNS